MSNSVHRNRTKVARLAGRASLLTDKAMGLRPAMTTTVKLDDLDLNILRHLNTDARKSFRDLAREVKASISTVLNRIHRLPGGGGVTGYGPLIGGAETGGG